MGWGLRLTELTPARHHNNSPPSSYFILGYAETYKVWCYKKKLGYPFGMDLCNVFFLLFVFFTKANHLIHQCEVRHLLEPLIIKIGFILWSIIYIYFPNTLPLSFPKILSFCANYKDMETVFN